MYNSFWYALSCVSCEIAIGSINDGKATLY